MFRILLMALALAIGAPGYSATVTGCTTQQQKRNLRNVQFIYQELKRKNLNAMETKIAEDFNWVSTCIKTDPWCNQQGLMAAKGKAAWRSTLEQYLRATTPHAGTPSAFYVNTYTSFTCIGSDTVAVNGFTDALVRKMSGPYRTAVLAIWKSEILTDGAIGPKFQSYFAIYDDRVLQPVWPLVFTAAH